MNISSDELENIITDLKKGYYPGVRSELEIIFDKLRDRIRLNENRDYFSAKSLTYMFKSGVHFVGLNHFRNTLKFLKQFCLQEQAKKMGLDQTRPKLDLYLGANANI